MTSLQIRRRPKDQSSDEDGDDDENKEQPTPLTPPSTLSNVQRDGDKSVDFTMFKEKGTRCGNDQNKGVIAECDALQRLAAALRAYSAMKELEGQQDDDEDDEMRPEHPALSEFLGSDYRLQFLEDFNHFMARHQDQEQLDALKQEMAEQFGMGRCEAGQCLFSLRHFGGDTRSKRKAVGARDARSLFYRQKLDALHFHIFHLLDSGYRHRAKPQTHGADENEAVDGNAVDRELEEAVTAINDSKKKWDIGRFQGGGPNKFTLNVSGISEGALLRRYS